MAKNVYGVKKRKVGRYMDLLVIVYVLILAIFGLVAFSIFQIKLAGIKVKDFWQFIEANQMLDKLYTFAKKYQNLSTQEQILFLSEAEKLFEAFDKMPSDLWEDEYQKYMEVLEKYRDIKILRWNAN